MSKIGLQAPIGEKTGTGMMTASGSTNNPNYKLDYGRLHNPGGGRQDEYMQYSGWLTQSLDQGLSQSRKLIPYFED